MNVQQITTKQRKFLYHISIHGQHYTEYPETVRHVLEVGYYGMESPAYGKASEADILRMVRLQYMEFLSSVGLKYPN